MAARSQECGGANSTRSALWPHGEVAGKIPAFICGTFVINELSWVYVIFSSSSVSMFVTLETPCIMK